MATAAVAAVSYITGLTGTAAVVATTAAATVLGTVAATALLSQNPNQKSQGQLNSLNLTSNAPRLWQIGKRGNGGSLVDHFSYGHKNEYAELVIYLGEGPMGNITGIWSSGRKVWTGTLQHGQRVQLNEFDSPDGRAWVEYYDGRPGQTASSRLVSATGGQWASTAVGEGCAYVIVTCRWDPDTMPAIASFFFENEGAKIYDRRKDTTAGGSGSHRLTDPATWELSSNPAVALDHYLLGLRRNASAEPTFGVGLDPSLVNYPRFSTMANLCDEAVTVTVTPWYTGTQPRYEANGIISASETYKDVILDLCRAMNARAADLGGEIAVIDNEVKTAVIDLTDYNVIDGTNESYVEKKSRDDLIGGVRGNYQNPDNNYNPADYPPYTDAQWAIDDGAVLEYDDFDLDYETDPERAQRLAKLHGLRLRRQATLSGVYDMAALILEDGDWFTRTTDKFPSGKTFEVIGSPLLDTGTMSITINAVEVDPSDTAWNAATDPAPVLQASPATTTFPASLGLPNITITPTTYTSPGGVSYPAIEVRNLDYNDSIAEGLQIEVALDDGGGSPLPNAQIIIMPAGREYVTLAPLVPDTDYLIRSRRFENARVSGWSAWTQFTSLSNFTVAAIINQGWGATASEGEASNLLFAPTRFVYPEQWTSQTNDATNGNSPQTIADAPSGWFEQTARGSVVRGTTTRTIYQKTVYTVVDGDTYQCEWQAYLNAIPSTPGYARMVIFALRFDENWNYIGSRQTISSLNVTSTGHAEQRATYTAAQLLSAYPNTKYVRFGVEMLRDDSTPEDGDCELIRFQAESGLFGSVAPGADVTGDNTAAAIVGQDWGATASEQDAGNRFVPVGQNSIIDNFYTIPVDSNRFNGNWYFGASRGSGGVNYPHSYSSSITETSDSKLRVFNFNFTAANGDTTSNGGDRPYHRVSTANAIPVKPGQRVGIRALVGGTNLYYVRAGLLFRDASGNYVSELNGSPYYSPGAGDGEADTFTEITHVHTVPANAALLVPQVDGRAISPGATRFSCAMMTAAILDDDGQVAPPLSPSYIASVGADTTANETALGIVGQGALATANEASRRRYEAMPGVSIKASVTTLDTITINTDGGPVELEWDFEAYYDFATGGSMQGPNRIMVRVLRNGATISGYREHCIIEATSRSTASNTMKHADLSSPGSAGSPVSTTYTLQAYQTDESGSGTIPSDLALIKVNSSKGAYLKATSYPADANDL